MSLFQLYLKIRHITTAVSLCLQHQRKDGVFSFWPGWACTDGQQQQSGRGRGWKKGDEGCRRTEKDRKRDVQMWTENGEKQEQHEEEEMEAVRTWNHSFPVGNPPPAWVIVCCPSVCVCVWACVRAKKHHLGPKLSACFSQHRQSLLQVAQTAADTMDIFNTPLIMIIYKCREELLRLSSNILQLLAVARQHILYHSVNGNFCSEH